MRQLTSAIAAVLLLATCGLVGGGNPPAHWPDCPVAGGPTSANATFILPSTLGFRNGDAVSVWTDDVGCIGQEVIQFGSRSSAITVWGDDPQTPAKDGAAFGDSLRLRVHLDRQADYELTADSAGNFRTVPTYQTDALFSVAWFDGGGGQAAAIDSLNTVIGGLEVQLAQVQAERDQLQADLTTRTTELADMTSQRDAALSEAQAWEADYVDLSDRRDQAVNLLTQ